MYKEKRVIRPNDEVVRYYCENGYDFPLLAMNTLMAVEMDFMKSHF